MNKGSESKPVLCIGDLVVDIFSRPIESIPGPGESILSERISILPGGNALNIAIALSKMGNNVKIAGSIGDDLLGDILIDQLKTNNLDVSLVNREKGVETSSTIIFRKEGEDRRFISSLGAAEKFTGSNISEGMLPQNGITVIGGYLKLAEWDDDRLSELLKFSKERGNIAVLNISYIRNSKVDPKRVFSILKHVDIFIPNEDEAAIITGTDQNSEQSRILRTAGAELVIITKGSDGLFAENSDYQVNMKSISVETVDPTGCGDCFTAGLVAGLNHGYDLVKLLKYSSAAGALSAAHLGCTTGIKNHAGIIEFLSSKQIEYTISKK
jgi:sugar/nucleoside kinase (ribokinase family)